MDFELEKARAVTRRTFFGQAGLGLGAMALGSLVEAGGSAQGRAQASDPLAPRKPMLPAKAKNVMGVFTLSWRSWQNSFVSR